MEPFGAFRLLAKQGFAKLYSKLTETHTPTLRHARENADWYRCMCVTL